MAGGFREGGAALLAGLRSAGPDRPCWSFGSKASTAAFWFRRQAHETVLHAWDADASQGRQSSIPSGLAADGVDEVLTLFFPRQVRMGRIPSLDVGLALEPTDVPGVRWVLAGDGTGPGSAPDAPASATLRAPAETLLLVLWKRATLDHPALRVDGDREAAVGALASALTP